MAKYILSRDVEIMFNGGGRAQDGYSVKAKAGTPLKPVMGGSGLSYAIPAGRCEVEQSVRALFLHDSKYYHIWAPADSVMEAK